ncbi:glycosyltransferase family 8 protein [Butyrivibrio fibrisolvens]|uniref:glycosyltransferase family 8 protein n=1 Tax=Butyrivibrio fibrisolvens TaxID=831 RepID=UPI00041150EA|nr:glycosyltransferase family 8 protein [Butyrivibrio fibrisolvens]
MDTHVCNDNKYTFVYMSDENFVLPTIVSIYSLTKHKRSNVKYEIHMILDAVPTSVHEIVEKISINKVDIVVHDIDCDYFSSIGRKGEWDSIYVSRTDMFKFELPNFLEDLDKVLYIDGDTIINHNIEPLFDVDIEDNYLAAVDDMGDVHDDNGVSNSFKRIGIKDNHYFNAGLMYLNLKKMREDNISKKLWEYRIHGKNFFMSQDALNRVVLGKRAVLPYKYNFLTVVFDMYSLEEINDSFCEKCFKNIAECLDEQIVLHMAGKMKPWEYNLPWITDLFLKYYNEVPFLSEKLQFKSPLKELTDTKTKMFRDMLWKFFELNICPGERVVLYGAGNIGKLVYAKNQQEKYCTIVMWLDKDADRLSNYYGMIISEPSAIESANCHYDKVVIANSSKNAVGAIKETLQSLGVELNKCIVVG